MKLNKINTILTGITRIHDELPTGIQVKVLKYSDSLNLLEMTTESEKLEVQVIVREKLKEEK